MAWQYCAQMGLASFCYIMQVDVQGLLQEKEIFFFTHIIGFNCRYLSLIELSSCGDNVFQFLCSIPSVVQFHLLSSWLSWFIVTLHLLLGPYTCNTFGGYRKLKRERDSGGLLPCRCAPE